MNPDITNTKLCPNWFVIWGFYCESRRQWLWKGSYIVRIRTIIKWGRWHTGNVQTSRGSVSFYLRYLTYHRIAGKNIFWAENATLLTQLRILTMVEKTKDLICSNGADTLYAMMIWGQSLDRSLSNHDWNKRTTNLNRKRMIIETNVK